MKSKRLAARGQRIATSSLKKRDLKFEWVLYSDRLTDDHQGRIQALRTVLARAGLTAVSSIAVYGIRTNTASTERVIPFDRAHSSKAAMVLAVPDCRAERLIFWPLEREPDRETVFGLVSNAEAFDILVAPRGTLSGWSVHWQDWAGMPVPMDLGAPLMIRRDSVARSIAPWSARCSFLAIRILKEAMANGASAGQLPVQGPVPAFMSSLGLRSEWDLSRNGRGRGFALGGLMVLTGLTFAATTLGLTSFGIGLLVLGHHFGRSE